MTEQEADALRRRLARLGRRGAKRPPAEPRRSRPPGRLPPGDEVSTPHGIAYRLEDRYAPDFGHGSGLLGELVGIDSGLVAEVAFQPDLQGVAVDRLAFIDTETTGLAGGAGTLVFLVGIGHFDEQGFRLRQYFLRDPAEERAMLFALREDLQTAEGFVTFNGRAFDIPLLEMRYVMGLRSRWELTKWPQIDLLHISRRLWSRELPDCTMSTIEQEVLGVERSEQDVPGAAIPGMYLDYLHTRSGGGMNRVIYHNAVDVLSLVTLAAKAVERHQGADLGRLSGGEALAVARWHQSADRGTEALRAYRAAIQSGSGEVRLEAFRRYTVLLKRLDRHEEALESWRQWHETDPADPRPCIELAKYYEWRSHDLGQAAHWAQEASLTIASWPSGWRRERMQAEIEHRLARIEGKRSRKD